MKTESILAKIEKARKSIDRLNGVIAKNEAKIAKHGEEFEYVCAVSIAKEDLGRRERELAVLLEKPPQRKKPRRRSLKPRSPNA